MERASAACSCCVDQRFCRLIGPAIGWMGIVTSIMVMKVFTQKSSELSALSLQVEIYDNIIVVVSGKSFGLNFFSLLNSFFPTVFNTFLRYCFSIKFFSLLLLADWIEKSNSNLFNPKFFK